MWHLSDVIVEVGTLLGDREYIAEYPLLGRLRLLVVEYMCSKVL